MLSWDSNCGGPTGVVDRVSAMKLLSTFYSRGGDLACGWWARIEGAKGRLLLRFLWRDAAGPDFDDLAAVVADLGSAGGLDDALQLARQDPQLVKRTKPVTQNTVKREVAP
jgi:hypothetical protein